MRILVFDTSAPVRVVPAFLGQGCTVHLRDRYGRVRAAPGSPAGQLGGTYDALLVHHSDVSRIPQPELSRQVTIFYSGGGIPPGLLAVRASVESGLHPDGARAIVEWLRSERKGPLPTILGAADDTSDMLTALALLLEVAIVGRPDALKRFSDIALGAPSLPPDAPSLSQLLAVLSSPEAPSAELIGRTKAELDLALTGRSAGADRG